MAEHYFRQRQLDKALENYQAVLREQERSLGSSDPATLKTLGQIANVHHLKNEFEHPFEHRAERTLPFKERGRATFACGAAPYHTVGSLAAIPALTCSGSEE